MVEVRVSARNMDLTDAIKAFCEEKISKHEYLFDNATGIAVELTQSVAHRGKAQDFSVDIDIDVPRARIHVNERGSDIYALVDKATDVLSLRMKRYKDKLTKWEGNETWKTKYLEELEDNIGDLVEEVEDFSEYEPKIAKRIKLEDATPMHEAEAIEHMELQGLTSFLFKNSDTSTWCLVRKKNGSYEVVLT